MFFSYLAFSLAFALAFVAVLLSVPIVNVVAKRLGYVDMPNHRKVHHRPMVRLGGIAIWLGTVVSVIYLWQQGHFSVLLPEQRWEAILIVLGGCGYFVLGLVDDINGLSPQVRLLYQFGIAGLVWLGGIRIEFVNVPTVGIVQLAWLSLPITLIWVAGMVNAINWMDGLDGLASGVTGISTVLIFILCLWMGEPSVAMLAICLVGSLCGFLVYNFNPARIFMGDGGAYFIGFMVATMSIAGLVKGATATLILVPLVALAVPILDMTQVIVMRTLSGRSPFTADKRHLHHRLLRVGLPHRWVVLVIYALTLWMGSWSLTLAQMPYGLWAVIISTPILLTTGWRAWQLRQA